MLIANATPMCTVGFSIYEEIQVNHQGTVSIMVYPKEEYYTVVGRMR
jgi:hypothetical protein